jgi:hypothetical protein
MAGGAGGLGAQGEGLATLDIPGDTLLSLEAIKLEMFHKRLEEQERYRAIVLYDADTTDAKSRNHSLARQVVMDAITAMGGQKALLQLRTMNYEGRFHKAYGPRSQYTQYLPGGARLVYDGKKGWVEITGKAYPLKGRGLREVEQRVERWDFLSRYLGDGVQLSYVERRFSDLGTRALKDRDYHVLLVDDRKFGGAFLAFFDVKTHLLAAEEVPPEHPLRRDLFLDYGWIGPAFIYQKVEHVDLKAWRYARSTSPVHYNPPTGEEMFAVSSSIPAKTPSATGAGIVPISQDVPAKTSQATSEVEGTLWVDVQTGSITPHGAPVLPGALFRLSGMQMAMVREHVEEMVVEELSRRGLFRRVTSLREGGTRQTLQPGDYLLEIMLKPNPRGNQHVFWEETYQARLLEASSMQQIMHDGPPYKGYYVEKMVINSVAVEVISRRECLFYILQPFTVEDDIAYVDQRRLRELISRTYRKIERALGLYRHGERSYFPYMDDCCYCQEP